MTDGERIAELERRVGELEECTRVITDGITIPQLWERMEKLEAAVKQVFYQKQAVKI